MDAPTPRQILDLMIAGRDTAASSLARAEASLARARLLYSCFEAQRPSWDLRQKMAMMRAELNTLAANVQDMRDRVRELDRTVSLATRAIVGADFDYRGKR